MRLSFCLIFILLLNGCIAKVKRGYVFDEKARENIEIIQVGKTTKNDIIFLLGAPSFVDADKEGAIFYAADVGIRIASLGDIIYKREIIRYDFNFSNVLVNVKLYHLKDRKFIVKDKIKVKIKQPNNFFSLPFYKLI